MIRNIITETSVDYDDEFIIFSYTMEDMWQEGKYMYEIIMYEPMNLADGSIVRHPFAYRNAGKQEMFQYSAFGHTSFQYASARMEAVSRGLIVDIMSLLDKNLSLEEVMEKLRNDQQVKGE